MVRQGLFDSYMSRKYIFGWSVTHAFQRKGGVASTCGVTPNIYLLWHGKWLVHHLQAPILGLFGGNKTGLWIQTYVGIRRFYMSFLVMNSNHTDNGDNEKASWNQSHWLHHCLFFLPGRPDSREVLPRCMGTSDGHHHHGKAMRLVARRQQFCYLMTVLDVEDECHIVKITSASTLPLRHCLKASAHLLPLLGHCTMLRTIALH
jgi:hypothetical protein